MKKYTQADFDSFEADECGRKICPSGDYTAITDFGERCSFGDVCSFGEWSSFGEMCSFGEQCRFGEWCHFGTGCRFGMGCSFGAGCRFGMGCSFGEQCSFGAVCRFGEQCSYENGAVKNGRYVAVDRIDNTNRKVYFYIDENGNMFVRFGSRFSDMATFKEWVKKAYTGIIHKETYLAACDLAELMLKGSNEE